MSDLAKLFLSRGGEPAFQQDMQFAPGYRDWRIGFARQYGEPPNTDPGGDYDYRTAWAAGVKPELAHDGTLHWASSTPGGRMLKAGNHPTHWKEIFMRQFGVDPDGADDRTVSDGIRNGVIPFVGEWMR